MRLLKLYVISFLSLIFQPDLKLHASNFIVTGTDAQTVQNSLYSKFHAHPLRGDLTFGNVKELGDSTLSALVSVNNKTSLQTLLKI